MALVRSLKLLILAGLGALLVVVALSLSASVRPGVNDAGPRSLPADPAGDPVVQQGSRVSLKRSREGAPTLEVQAAASRTRASGVLELDDVAFLLFGADGATTRITAPTASSMPAAGAAAAVPPPDRSAPAPASGPGFTPALRRNMGSWVLTGGVAVSGAGDLRLNAPSLVYDEATGVARSNDPVSFRRGPATGGGVGMEYDLGAQTVRFLSDVTAAMTIGGLGEVRVTAREASYDTRTRAFRMTDYECDTSRGEHLAGATLDAVFLAEGGLERLEGSDGFELTTIHVVPAADTTSPLARLLALEGKRTMRGQRLTIRFDTDDRPGTIEVSGQASLVTGAQEGSSVLDAETLTFDLIRGSLTRARAAGDVALSKEAPGAEGKGFRMKSENLDASFDPNAGSLLGLAGEGHIQLWDEGIESQGSRTFLDPNTDVVTLVGDGDAPARVTWSGRKVEARRIQVDRRRETLTARDGVRASYTPQAGAPSGGGTPPSDPLPFFRPGETIHAIADVLTVSDDGRAARYEGSVRLWQGESRLEAGQVEVHETDGTLSAGGEVTTTFRQPPAHPPAGPRSPTEDIASVSSATMTYRRRDNRVDYAGGVLATQAAMRVTADSLAVFLKPGSGSAERMEASGQVELRERGRVGKGDRLFVDLVADTLKLAGTGREATVQDESSQQVVRGLALTMDRAGDRILVESELGGRTWITLKPRQKGAPGVGSDPDD